MSKAQKLFKYTPKVDSGCIYGKWGFSLTSDILTKIAKNIVGYSLLNGISSVVVGYDSCSLTKTLAVNLLCPALNTFGLSTNITKEPCPQFQVSWLLTQTKEKQLGIYISTHWFEKDLLMLSFRDNSGYPLSKAHTKSLLSNRKGVSIHTFEELISSPTSALDLSSYKEYLIDSNLINTSIGSVACVDTMFGSTEALLSSMQSYPLKLVLYSKQSQGIVLSNYSQLPTSTFLRAHAQAAKIDHPSCLYLFALSSMGDSLGLFDLKHNEEVSTSGLALILLYLYKTYYNKVGIVSLSRALSDRVKKVAKSLGFKVKLLSSLSKEHIQLINLNEEWLFHIDDSGRFWFKGAGIDSNPVVAMYKIIEGCSNSNKSPGELVDHISSLYLTREFPYANLILPRPNESSFNFREVITDDEVFKIKRVVQNNIISVFYLENNTKICISLSNIENSYKVFIESDIMDKVTDAAERIKTLYVKLIEKEYA